MLILILGAREDHDLVATCRELIRNGDKDFKVEVVSDVWVACSRLRNEKVVAIVCLSPNNETIDFVNQAARELTTAGSTLGAVIVVDTVFPRDKFSGLVTLVKTDEEGEEYSGIIAGVGKAMNYARRPRSS